MRTKIWLISIIILLVDQISKQIVIASISYGEKIKVINNFFYLNHTQNKGAAWSLFQGSRYILIIIAFVFLLYLIKVIKEEKKLSIINVVSYGLLIGGIVGNLIDRIVFGYVVDFFELHIFNYVFPIFNVADIAIITGTFIMIFVIIREWWKVEGNKGK